MSYKSPKISEAEWKVMRVLWAADSPLPAYDIILQLSGSESWQPKTVKTLLARLVKKRAVGYSKYKNLYLYRAAVNEEEAIRTESESFLERCFGGALQPMLAHFVGRRRLTRAELDELREILNQERR